MNKKKKVNYWAILIVLVLVMLAFGYFFELGELLGKSIAN